MEKSRFLGSRLFFYRKSMIKTLEYSLKKWWWQVGDCGTVIIESGGKGHVHG